jgi:hypothetical protein
MVYCLSLDILISWYPYTLLVHMTTKTNIYSSYNLQTPPLPHIPHYVQWDDNFTFTNNNNNNNNNNVKLYKVELLITLRSRYRAS